MNKRVKALKASFAGHGVDSMLISRPADTAYLSRFTGSGCLLVLPEEVRILTDSRYTEQAAEEAPGAVVTDTKGKFADVLFGFRKKAGRLGFDSSYLTYNAFMEISAKLKKDLVPLNNPVSPLRAIKDAQELNLIKKCADIAQAAFTNLRETIGPGVTEKEAADELEYIMRKLGASSAAFPTIVASAANASLPHFSVSQRRFKPYDAVLIDWGVCSSGYNSDTTRMLFLNEPTTEYQKLHAAVLEAHKLGLAALRPGRKAVEVDAAARDYLRNAGYDDLFAHGLGHGVGREIHEAPNLSPRSKDILKEGMVVTIEPGLYRPGWGGIRIEDMAVVTATGYQLITSLPRDLEASIAGG